MSDETQQCPSCGSSNTRTVMAMDWFKYGLGPNPIDLSAEVEMTNCYECGEKFSGEQGIEAREAAVKAYLLSVFPQLLVALKAQHDAIDILFATLIAKTMHSEKPYYPTESGKPWQAIQLGKAAIEAAGGAL